MMTCELCGSRPRYKLVDASDYDGPSTQRVPVACSNRSCPNSDPRQVDFDSFVGSDD